MPDGVQMIMILLSGRRSDKIVLVRADRQNTEAVDKVSEIELESKV